MQPAAIKGTFADFKLVKTRKLAQVVIEIPIEEADHALAVLGGLPRSDGERWVAIARLTAGAAIAQQADTNLGSAVSGRNTSGSPAPKRRRKWSDRSYAERAGILCATPDFQHWIGAIDAESAADRLRGECRVRSRREIDGSVEAREFFEAMHYRYINRNQPPPHTEPR